MVITDKFVYIHMPKTGGTFVEAVLQRLLSKEGGLYIDTSTQSGKARLQVRDQHQTVSDIPEAHRDKPLVLTIRNPYDHYVSFYEFAWWKNHPGDTFDEGRIRLRHPHFPELTFREYLESVFDWPVLDQTYIEPSAARLLQAADVGPLTFDYVRYLFEQPEAILRDLPHYFEQGRYRAELSNVHLLRAESLNRSLYEYLVAAGYEPERVRFVLRLGRIYPDGSTRNPTSRWQDYYTPALRRLVGEKERFLFAMFPQYDV